MSLLVADWIISLILSVLALWNLNIHARTPQFVPRIPKSFLGDLFPSKLQILGATSSPRSLPGTKPRSE